MRGCSSWSMVVGMLRKTKHTAGCPPLFQVNDHDRSSSASTDITYLPKKSRTGSCAMAELKITCSVTTAARNFRAWQSDIRQLLLIINIIHSSTTKDMLRSQHLGSDNTLTPDTSPALTVSISSVPSKPLPSPPSPSYNDDLLLFSLPVVSTMAK